MHVSVHCTRLHNAPMQRLCCVVAQVCSSLQYMDNACSMHVSGQCTGSHDAPMQILCCGNAQVSSSLQCSGQLPCVR